MPPNYLDELPPELIALLPASLPTASLNTLVQSSRRLHEILQPALESRLTLELGRKMLWAAEAKPHIVAKLLSPPHSMSPNGYGLSSMTPLHVAAKAWNLETAALLLDAGADPAAEWDQDEYQPLHFAVRNKHLNMMRLLLQHGAPVDSKFGCDGYNRSALHVACASGHMEMIQLLLEHGASLERTGHFGTALGFAVHYSKVDVVKFLLERGADASVTAPLYILLVGGGRPPLPHKATLLYAAMGLRPPSNPRRRPRTEDAAKTKWVGLPLGEGRKQLMALLLAHGASKETIMKTISRHLAALAKEAQYTEEEYLEVIEGMFKEAEDAIPDVLSAAKAE
ncbi:ankyrin repeat-containing domain protein [Mycena latifolia]|nr:ankyrin repeat-containing domain protein [Mycena latifolia]